MHLLFFLSFGAKLREGDAPIAVGRSGTRQEKGISASGLLGERLMTSNDPKLNSFAQRSWLYADEKSIYYRKNDNIPQAEVPQDMCLPIGGELSNEPFLGWAYGRKAVLTGNDAHIFENVICESIFTSEND
jgi:hypothetical protein